MGARCFSPEIQRSPRAAAYVPFQRWRAAPFPRAPRALEAQYTMFRARAGVTLDVVLRPAAKRRTPSSTPIRLLKLYSRSEEHTSELQSLTNLVCRLLLEKT